MRDDAADWEKAEYEAWINSPRSYPSLRNEIDGFWTVQFRGFDEAAITWTALYKEFGMDEDAAREAGAKWAIQHGYIPDGYKKRRHTNMPYDDLKARYRVEDVAARLTELRAQGPTTRKGRCPFHVDKTPSFIVWTKSQRWRCFGACATGGDVIDLLKKAGELG